jgi:hypothetical protein
MNHNFSPTLAVFVTVTLIGSVLATAIPLQQASAPRTCAGCTEFKKLTHEFEKDVIDAATIGDPGLIPGLLEQYKDQVSRLFTGPE